ncbi:hypothetical protein V8F33_011360 [Rhypophila sp. PSN 637]
MAFRFEWMPPEIRLRIYREILVCDDYALRIRPEEADTDKTIAYEESAYNKRFRSQILPNIPRSCRGVYHKAIDILYSENKFLTASPSALIDFWKKIGKNAQSLRTLNLRLIFRSRAMTWLNAMRKLAKKATGLLRLHLDLMESQQIQYFGLNFVFGFEPWMLQGFGDALEKMRALDTVVVTGARGYSIDWSIYFPTMTKAAVEADARKLSPVWDGYPFNMGSYRTMNYPNTLFVYRINVKAFTMQITRIPISNSDYNKLVDTFENTVAEVPNWDYGTWSANTLILLASPRAP